MQERPGLRSVLVPAAFFIFWVGVCISALLRQLASPDPGDWLAVLIILAVGGFGAWGLARSVIKAFRRWDGGA